MSFAAGFFGTLSKNIESKRDFIRNKVEEDRLYLREQGLHRMARVQEQRGTYETAARGLIRRGVDEQSVLTAMESDPQGILEVYREATSDRTITKEALNAVFNIGNEYRTDATLSQVLEKILPTVTQLPADADPTTVRRKSLASWLNLDTEEEISEQVYNAQVVGGMTGDQILASMNIPVTARGEARDDVSFNFEAMTPTRELSQGEVTDWFTRSLEEYEPMVLQREAEIKQQLVGIERDDTMTTEQKNAIREELRVGKEALDNLPTVKQERLEALIGLMGVLPNTQTYFDMYPELFSTKYGFNTTTTELFTPRTETGGIITTDLPPAPSLVERPTPEVTPEVETPTSIEASSPEDAAGKVEEFFTNNPNRPYTEVTMNGQTEIVENKDYFENMFMSEEPNMLGAIEEVISGPSESLPEQPVELRQALSDIVFAEGDEAKRAAAIEKAIEMVAGMGSFEGKDKLVVSLIKLRGGF